MPGYWIVWKFLFHLSCCKWLGSGKYVCFAVFAPDSGREFACTSSNICPLIGKYWQQIFWDGWVMIRFVTEYDLSREICLESIGVRLFQKYLNRCLLYYFYALWPEIVVCLWGPGERGPRPIERALWQKGLHVGPWLVTAFFSRKLLGLNDENTEKSMACGFINLRF